MSDTTDPLIETIAQALMGQETATAALEALEEAADKDKAALALATARLSDLQGQLEAERSARAQAEARCTTMMAELRRPVPEQRQQEPVAYELKMTERDGNDRMRAMVLVPIKNPGGG